MPGPRTIGRVIHRVFGCTSATVPRKRNGQVACRVVILQSNYIPWRGYFDLIGLADVFVLYDEVQYTKNDWRNRNRVRTANGAVWLTVPVRTNNRFGQRIRDTRIADRRWAAKHWRTLSQAYAKAAHFEAYRSLFARLYGEAAEIADLSTVNRHFLDAICGVLGIDTPMVRSEALPGRVGQTERLVDICRALEATCYLTGPAARDYLDERQFADAGIAVDYMDYAGYRPYPQCHGGYDARLSIVDLLFNVGDAAAGYLSKRCSPCLS